MENLTVYTFNVEFYNNHHQGDVFKFITNKAIENDVDVICLQEHDITIPMELINRYQDEEGINKDKAVDVIDSGVHLGLDNVTFNEEALDGAVIFKSSTDRLVHSYSTDEFKNLYDKNGFKGLKFEKVMSSNHAPN